MNTSGKRPVKPDSISGFYAQGFDPIERRDLEDALRSGLADEIAMLRVFIRRVFELTSDPEELEQARQALNALGLAATRLARLLKVDREISGDAGHPFNAINEALNQVIEEMRQEGKII